MRIISTKTYREMKDKIEHLSFELNESRKKYIDILDKYDKLLGENEFLRIESERLKDEIV